MNKCIGFCGKSRSSCSNSPLSSEKFCQKHSYMKDYTSEMLNNLTYRNCCHNWIYVKHRCEKCAQKLLEYRQKKKLTEQKCLSDKCMNIAKNEGYCGRHDNERSRAKIITKGFKTCSVSSCLEELALDYPFKKCRKHLDEDNLKDRLKYANYKSDYVSDSVINDNANDNDYKREKIYLSSTIFDPITINSPMHVISSTDVLKNTHRNSPPDELSNKTLKQKIPINLKPVVIAQSLSATSSVCSSLSLGSPQQGSKISTSNQAINIVPPVINKPKSNSQRQTEYIERKKKEMGEEAYNAMIAEKKRLQRERAKKKNDASFERIPFSV